ncbi:OsmC family protein [Kordia sp.]|uniref:OsmC family protein n=1 Tax=Kordia sp. TaxID=1965332 RepID=UPI003D6B8A6C
MENSYLETFKADAKGKGIATKVNIIDTEWTIQTDEPVDGGGTNTGPNPMQLFIASVAACQNEQAQVVAKELSLNISGIDFKVEIDLDLSGFMGVADDSNGSYKNIRLEALVSGDVTNDEVKTLGQKVDNRCPILALLRTSGCKIESNWNEK